jgi:hypothetical protein
MDTLATPSPAVAPSAQRLPQPALAHPAVFRIGDMAAALTGKTLASGWPVLDAELPGGGWPCAGLCEILCDHNGIGELSLIAPALAAAQGAHGTVLLVLPPQSGAMPYAPGLAGAGIDLMQLAIVRPGSRDDALWAAEQALKSGACRAVCVWVGGPQPGALPLRRLAQAALAGNTLGFALRPSVAARQPSPAMLRVRLTPAAQGLLHIDLIKRRGLPPGKSIAIDPRALACLAREARQAANGAQSATSPWLARLLDIRTGGKVREHSIAPSR